MTQDNSPATVINFQKLGRRKGVARLTKNYSSILAHILSCSELDDGEHVDENDLPITRPLDRTESRHGAVVTAAQFFYALMTARAKLETPSDGADDLYAFEFRASGRIKRYHEANLGKYKIVIQGKYKRDLMAIERNYFQAIFDALRIEARNNPELDEAEFWADVFRGMGDADPSGVVLRAAGLVLLDHLPHFQHALTQHTAHALRK